MKMGKIQIPLCKVVEAKGDTPTACATIERAKN
jgi:hypothetical protein